MASVSKKTVLNAPLDQAWSVVGDFNGLPRFVSAVAQSTVEGSGTGALRTLTLQDGGKIVERLESFDEGQTTLQYSIVSSPLPVDNYLSTMKLASLDDGRCELEWSSTFDPKGVPQAEAEGIIGGIYEMGFEGLNKLYPS